MPSIGVVRAVERDDLDLGAALAVAVDAALALLVAGRVPREVVVDDRVEAVLEVDALGQAIGRHEHALAGARAGRRREPAGRRRPESRSPTSTVTSLRQRLAERVAATYSAVAMKRQKTIGCIAVREQFLDDRRALRELGVLAAGERLGRPRKAHADRR